MQKAIHSEYSLILTPKPQTTLTACINNFILVCMHMYIYATGANILTGSHITNMISLLSYCYFKFIRNISYVSQGICAMVRK